MRDKKRGGRKPGSKNKPKIEYTKEVVFHSQKLNDLQQAVSSAIGLLEIIASTKVSAMDSESRLASLARLQIMTAQAALDCLREAL